MARTDDQFMRAVNDLRCAAVQLGLHLCEDESVINRYIRGVDRAEKRVLQLRRKGTRLVDTKRTKSHATNTKNTVEC
jgi:hypothetical protein